MAKSKHTYVVNSSLFGHMLNRDVVEEGALEGRTVPPVVKYLSKGSRVELTEEQAKPYLASGALEVPGESAKREKERLQVRVEELQAEQDRLAEEQKRVEQTPKSLDDLTKPKLEALAEEHNVDLSGASNNAERVQALREAGVSAPE